MSRIKASIEIRATGIASTWNPIAGIGITATRITVYKTIHMNDSLVKIRSADNRDLDSLVAANLALAEETEQVRLDEQTLREGIGALLESRAPGRYWVAELDGRVVGQLLVTFEWSDWRNRMIWWIQSVYVAPAHRGRGVLRTLYQAARREALAEGAGGLRLYVDTTNVAAQKAYAALGMNGDHYRVFEDMFAEPTRVAKTSGLKLFEEDDV